MAVMIFILLVVLYTLACVADGPDIKPRWQQWLNYPKLYADAQREANYLRMMLEMKPTQVECVNFVSEKIESHVLIDEWHIHECMRFERFINHDREHKVLIPRQYSVDRLVEDSIERCKKDIFRELIGRNLINIRVDKESRWPNIVIDGYLIVGKKKQNV